ncbi:putative thioesterase [Desulfosarcina cetonica]|nr:putative thioesterase [Desulfosarcina cetonica]
MSCAASGARLGLSRGRIQPIALSLGDFHHGPELVEQIGRIMGPGRRFRMVLDGKGRQPAVPDAFHGVVVQVDVGHLHGIPPQALHIDGKAVILGGDLHPAGIQVLDRLVGPAMAELELVSTPAQGQTENLVAQADAENGQPAEQLPGGLDAVNHRLRVPGTVGEEQPVGSHGHDGRGVGGGRHHQHLESGPLQTTTDIVFETEIDGHDGRPIATLAPDGRIHAGVVVQYFRLAAGPAVCPARAHVPGEVHAHHTGNLIGAPLEGFGIEIFRGNDRPHGAAVADMARQGPRVQPLDTQDTLPLEVVGQGLGGPEIAVKRLIFLDQERRHLDPGGLHIIGIDAVVAHQWIGHGHHLTTIGRIGEDLLVAGHTGVENHLAAGFPRTGERPAGKGATILECQSCFHG